MAGTGVPKWRVGIGRQRMVAPQFREADGRIDGPGRSGPNELSPARNALGSVYQERRVDDPRQTAVLRHRDAAKNRRDPAGRHYSRRTTNQDRWESVASGERRRDGRFRPGVDSRSLRSDALEAFRSPWQDERSDRVRILSRRRANDSRLERRRWSCLLCRRNAFAHTRTFAWRVGKNISKDALVRLRSASEPGTRLCDAGWLWRPHASRAAIGARGCDSRAR